MPDAQHSRQVVGHLVLRLVLAIHVVDELVERLCDRVHIDFVLLVHALGELISHVAIHVLTRGDQVLLDARQRVVLLHLQVDDLVWDDSHALQGQCLDTRPGEALDDPALALALVALDLLLHEINHDLIIDYRQDESNDSGYKNAHPLAFFSTIFAQPDLKVVTHKLFALVT